MKTQAAPKPKREMKPIKPNQEEADMLQASLGDDDDWLPGMSDGDFAAPVPRNFQQ